MSNLGASVQLSRFAELEARRRELEEELKVIEQEQGELEPQVLEQFVESGVSKVTINGLTVYMSTTLWAGVARRDDETPEDAYERACARLTELGLGDFVQTRFNTQSLSAYFREQQKAPGGIALEAFEGAIEIGEKVKLRARKAA